MLSYRKFFLMVSAAAIATSGSALANPKEEQDTRGLQLERTDLNSPPERSLTEGAQSTSLDENETVARIRAFRAAPHHMKGYEKALTAGALYEALSQCVSCSAGTLFAGYSDLIAFYTHYDNVPLKNHQSAIAVLKQGVDRLINLQKNDQDGSLKISPSTASNMILRLIKMAQGVNDKNLGSVFETYLKMSQSSGSPELQSQVLGHYFIWSLQYGHDNQPLILLESISALPENLRLIPFKVHYGADELLGLRTDTHADWSNLTKAIAYARAGQIDKARLLFAEYRNNVESKPSASVSTILFDPNYQPDEFLRAEKLYNSAIGSQTQIYEESNPRADILERYLPRRKPTGGGRIGPFSITPFTPPAIDVDAELKSLWQNANCNEIQRSQNYLCPSQKAYELLKGNFSELRLYGGKYPFLLNACKRNFTENYITSLFQKKMRDLNVYEASLMAFNEGSRTSIAPNSDCTKNKEPYLRYLTGQENYNVPVYDENGEGPISSFAMPPLTDDEAFIEFYINDEFIYTWVAISGALEWRRVNIEGAAIGDLVSQLRSSLTFSQDKNFDIKIAHDIYNLLFSNIEDIIGNKKNLYIVAGGPLSPLPFNALIKSDKSSIYRNIHWLARDHAVTMFSSLEALIYAKSQRRVMERGSPTFISYYDPVFTTSDQDKGANRGVVVNGSSGEFANLDTGSIFVSLGSLPGTKNEIDLIAGHFPKNAKTLLSGLRASEKDVKQRDLSQFSIVYFATHGLTAGQLEPFTHGVVQPGLALSHPGISSLTDDGVLQEFEIYHLKLAADLVVLSGCNTANNSGSSQSPISGLADAFLNAGARSVIATHWEISDAESARVMGGMFNALATPQGTDVSVALQQSILSYIDNATDDSLTHPRYWAPFFVINAYPSRLGPGPVDDEWKAACGNKNYCIGGHSTSQLNCNNPSNPTEFLICGDARLTALHKKMMRLAGIASRNGLDSFSAIHDWVGDKQANCRTKSCLIYQTSGHIDFLNNYLAKYKPGLGYALEGLNESGEWELRQLYLIWSSNAVNQAKCEAGAQLGEPFSDDVIRKYRCVPRIAESAPIPPQQSFSGSESQRGYLGVGLQTIDENLAAYFGLPAGRGELVQMVGETSPAEKAGLRSGDIIIKVEGKDVTADQTVSHLVANLQPGSTISVELLREQKQMNVFVTLGKRPSDMELETRFKAGE
jgi:CHAT domain-containing protein